jgi:protein-S-isoprenylcysteine O-methyltransferase Ste14
MVGASAPAHEADKAGVLIFPPLLLAGGIAFGAVVSLIFPVHRIAATYAIPSAVCTIIAALGIDRWAQRSLRMANTAVHPANASTAVVCGGPFKYSRNPIYLAQGLLLISAGLLLRNLAYFVALVPWYVVMRFGIIAREERYLARKFGAEYAGYRGRVRRWF